MLGAVLLAVTLTNGTGHGAAAIAARPLMLAQAAPSGAPSQPNQQQAMRGSAAYDLASGEPGHLDDSDLSDHGGMDDGMNNENADTAPIRDQGVDAAAPSDAPPPVSTPGG